jgi:hypothetical protein
LSSAADLRAFLIPINGAVRSLADAQWMERIDWVYGLSLAATLALAGGAICILLFAM